VPVDGSTDPDDAERSVGLDALRAAARDERGPIPWRALLEARVGASPSIWVVAVLAALALGVGLVALVHGRSTPTASSGSTSTPDLPMAAGAGDATSASAGSGGSATSSSAAAADAPLVVQVAGAVRRPGVFHLPAGSRLGDLVERAGGLTSGADVDRIDLAAPLADGALVYLPDRGRPVPPGPVIGGGAPSSGSGGAASSLVDLNTATAEQLDALPGVGPTTAAAIVAYRSQHGPFRSVDDLTDVTGIGPAKLAQIRPHVHL